MLPVEAKYVNLIDTFIARNMSATCRISILFVYAGQPVVRPACNGIQRSLDIFFPLQTDLHFNNDTCFHINIFVQYLPHVTEYVCLLSWFLYIFKGKGKVYLCF